MGRDLEIVVTARLTLATEIPERHREDGTAIVPAAVPTTGVEHAPVTVPIAAGQQAAAAGPIAVAVTVVVTLRAAGPLVFTRTGNGAEQEKNGRSEVDEACHGKVS